MKYREYRKDQFVELLGKHGKQDVLDVVPWLKIQSAEFEDEDIGGTCLVFSRGGEEWLDHIKIRHDLEGLEALLTILHEAGHARASIFHDRRFAACCWALVLRAGVFDFYSWQAWVKTRGYDIQADPDGQAWAKNNAAQIARSNPLMFRLRLLRLKLGDFNLFKIAAGAAVVLAPLTFVVASHFR